MLSDRTLPWNAALFATLRSHKHMGTIVSVRPGGKAGRCLSVMMLCLARPPVGSTS